MDLNIPAAVLCRESAYLIRSQPNFDATKEQPDIPKIQRAAKLQAQEWIEEIDPKMVEINCTIIDCANSFEGTNKTMLTLIPELENNDTEAIARKKLVGLIEDVIIPDLERNSTIVDDIAKQVEAFNQKFNLAFVDFQKSVGSEIEDKQKNLIKIKNEASHCGWTAVGLSMAAVAGGGTAAYSGAKVLSGSTCNSMAMLVQWLKTMSGIAKKAAITKFLDDKNAPSAENVIEEIIESKIVSFLFQILYGSNSAATGAAKTAVTSYSTIAIIVGGIIVFFGGVVGACYYYKHYCSNCNRASKIEILLEQYRNMQAYTEQIVSATAEIAGWWHKMIVLLRKVTQHLKNTAKAGETIAIMAQLNITDSSWKSVLEHSSKLTQEDIEEAGVTGENVLFKLLTNVICPNVSP